MKFTPKTLAEFYAAAPSEDAVPDRRDDYNMWAKSITGPGLLSDIDKWRWPPPKKKVVDLSVLITSGIDCEFSYDSKFESQIIGKLGSIEPAGYRPPGCGVFTHCRPRINHWHSWQGGECPLPEGFRVEVKCRSIDRCLFGAAESFKWSWSDIGSDIIAFRVLPELADGWAMPWE